MGTEGRGTKARPEVTLKLQDAKYTRSNNNPKGYELRTAAASGANAHMVALGLPWMCGMAKWHR